MSVNSESEMGDGGCGYVRMTQACFHGPLPTSPGEKDSGRGISLPLIPVRGFHHKLGSFCVCVVVALNLTKSLSCIISFRLHSNREAGATMPIGR